jgi:hypothetical protein
VAGETAAFSKADARFWLKRLFKWGGSPNYSCRIQFQGRRMTFALNTANRDLAAKRMANYYRDFTSVGVEAALNKDQVSTVEKPVEITTVGRWIELARGVSSASPTTFGQYAASLRLIASQILAVRKTNKRFGPGKGGAQAYRASIDSAPLDILSEQAVQRWRLGYIARVKNPAQERSRMTSANSTLRQARSLFAEKIVRFFPDIPLPSPRPFAHAGLRLAQRLERRPASTVERSHRGSRRRGTAWCGN